MEKKVDGDPRNMDEKPIAKYLIAYLHEQD